MKEGNVVRDKSFAFAARIVKLFQHLSAKKKNFILSNQILRSGTSIGANVEEAIGAQSRKDFISKLSIAYKETRETRFWLRLIHESDILNSKEYFSLNKDCEELLKILTSIIKSTKSPAQSKSIINF